MRPSLYLLEMFPNDPVSLTRAGGRSQNQDCVYPQPGQVSISDRLFLVCDGVGGAAKGEVASGMLCRRFPVHVHDIGKEQPAAADFQQALDKVSEEMRDYVQGDPAASGMATTFSMVHFGREQLTMSWCGDSRVYLARQGEILYHTFDHSLVGRQVAAGLLTWEAARTHPKSNVITRTVNADTAARADFKVFPYDTLATGDYILLCTDGVLEVFSNAVLEKLMDGKNTPKRVANAIDEKCRWGSSDNYTIAIFQLKQDKA